MINNKLQKLYQQIDRCLFCKKEGNTLQHIHGYGVLRPRLMFVLINPTYRNISSDPQYRGDRFPFLGVRQFWRVLADGGLVNRKIAFGLPRRLEWTRTHTEQIKNELVKNKFFLTNIVKCCYCHSAYPHQKVITNQLKLLGQEIDIVKPEKIVAFGGLVYKTLTRETIKLSDYWKNGNKKSAEILSGLHVPVTPCYFPIGRGNPRKAIKILKKLARMVK